MTEEYRFWLEQADADRIKAIVDEIGLEVSASGSLRWGVSGWYSVKGEVAMVNEFRRRLTLTVPDAPKA